MALASLLGTGVPLLRLIAQERELSPPPVQEPVDWAKARALLQKRQQGMALRAEEEAYLRKAQAARRGTADGPRPMALQPQERTGLKPLSDMSADDRYQGEEGGLYGGGSNVPPPAHRRLAEQALKQIQPRAADGTPDPRGRIVLLSISMSNATQEFSRFKQLADADSARAPQVTIVDGAQGGQAMAEWALPQAPPWAEVQRRLARAQVTPRQVQAAWIKLANKSPSGALQEHGQKLLRDTRFVVRIAKEYFPNLQIAYLSSRTYGGYATTRLNPEPYAYESAFVVRWLIQEQVRGAADLNADPQHGPVVAPVLLWGPYLWADGMTPRASDGLRWTRDDFAGDGTHPSEEGRQKVARMLLNFFQTDPLARPWFVRP